MSDDLFDECVEPSIENAGLPGTKEVSIDAVKDPVEPGFGDMKAMVNYDRTGVDKNLVVDRDVIRETYFNNLKKEEMMCDSLGRTTMQITPEGGGKFTTLTFVVPRTAEEKAQLKVDIELALRYGQKYGKKES